MAAEVKGRMREVFRRFVTDEAELHAVFCGEPILSALSIDSLAMLNLVNELEIAFGVRFDYETIETVFEDIHSLAAFLSVGPERAHGCNPRSP